MKNQFSLILLVSIFSLIFASSAYAENLESSYSTIYVNGSHGSDSNNGTSWEYAKKTIENAVGTVASGGTVNIASGTYKGDDNKYITINKNLNINGNGNQGTQNTTIDAENNDLIFHINSGCTVVISNIILLNGGSHNTGGDDGNDGGAVTNDGTLTITNCTFINNHARNGVDANAFAQHAGHGGSGGAIYNKGTLNIANSYFDNNYAGRGGDASDIHDGDYGGSGGAIYNAGTSTITNSSFNGNYAGRGGNSNAAAKSGLSGHGGAIYNIATLTLTDCIFEGNFAGNGGAASGLTSGTDGGNGGAIYNNGALITIQNSTFTTNHAGNGGSTQSGSAWVGGNGGNGGAIYNNPNVKINIFNCIFDSNYSGNGAEGTDLKAAPDGGNGGTIYNYGIISISGGLIKNSTTGTGGDAHGAFSAGDGGSGGAIYNKGNLTINDNNIYDSNCGIGKNAATAGSHPGLGGNGGGIYNEGNLTISDSGIEYNNAGASGNAADFENGGNGGNGGGIYNKGNLTLQNCEIHHNKAGHGGLGSLNYQAGNGGNGGGVYNEGNLNILQNTKIHENNAGDAGDGEIILGFMYGDGGEGGYGAGIYNSGNLTITGNSTNLIEIYSNKAGTGGKSQNPSGPSSGKGGNGGKGGGIYNKGQICNITYANIHDNKGGDGNDGDHESYLDVDGGDGGDGGAIFNEGKLKIEESNLTSNQGGLGKSGMEKTNTMNYGGGEGGNGGSGGAIANSGDITIINCQFTGNKGGQGGKGGQATYSDLGGEGGHGGNGGAIYNTGTLNLTGSSFNENSGGTGGEGGLGRLIDHVEDDGHDILVPMDPGNGGEGGCGGAIFSSGTIKSINNTIIENNTAGTGGLGGLYGSYDYIYFIKYQHYGGSGGSGGGIYSAGYLNLENTIIKNNRAGNGGDGQGCTNAKSDDGGEGGNGGGILIYGSIASTIQIINCTISNNQAGNGGNGGPTYISENNFYAADDPGDGGNGGSGSGIHIYYENKSNNPAITINISNSTISNNMPGNGGNGGIDTIHSKSSNGGNGGNGGGIGITSQVISNPAHYNLLLNMWTSTIINNSVGTGGQPYLSGVKGSDGVGGGLYSSDNHYFIIYLCRILNNTPQAVYLNLSTTNAYTNLWNNWWGSNNEPKDQITGKNINSSYYSPWIILNINASSNLLYPNQTSNITTNLIMNSIGQNTYQTYGMYVPEGIPVEFASNIGNVNPENSIISAGASSTIFNPDSTGGTGNVSATVDNQTVYTLIYMPLADVNITKTVDKTTANVGDIINYTITARNNGPDNATGLQIIDLIPAGLANPTYKVSTGTYNLGTGLWNIGTLLNGATATLNITGTVTSAWAGQNITNYANRTAQTEYNNLSNTTSATTYTKKADISISQTVNSPVNVNDHVTYQITVTNNGPDTATNINIRDILPSLFSAGTPSVGTFNNTSGIWNIPSLAHLASASLNISGIANSSMAGKTTNNTVTWINQTEYDPTPSTSTVGFYTKKADIVLTQTVNGAGSTKVNVNDIVTYIITAANNGPDNATGLEITDLLPVGFIFQSANTHGTGTFNQTTGIWNIGSLVNGATATLNITGLAGSSMAGLNLTNYANKTAQNEYSSLSNTTNTTVYTKLSAVTITNIANQSSLNVGQTASFTLTVTNNGPDLANIQITDLLSQLPSGFTAGTPTSGIYNSNTGIWTINNLTTGIPVILTFSGVLQNATAGTNITNHATATKTEYPFTVSITDATIYVKKADISISQTVNSPVNVNDHVTYQITVTNNGPDTATNINIRDVLPSLFSAGTPSVGTFNNTSGIWNIPSLAHLASASLNISGIATSSMAGKTTNNTVTWINQTEYDPTPSTSTVGFYTKKVNVSVTETVNGASSAIVNVNDTVTYIITAVNTGPDNATGLVVTDIMPQGLYNLSFTASTGQNTYNLTSGLWNIGTLFNGAVATLNITGTVTSALAGLNVTNYATITALNEYNQGISSSNASFYVPCVNVSIFQHPWCYDFDAKAFQTVSSYYNVIVYNVDVKNTGVDDATGVVIKDVLGDAYQFVGLSTEGVGTASYDSLSRTITWNISKLPKNTMAVLSIFALVVGIGNNTPNLLVNASLEHVDQYDLQDSNKWSNWSVYVGKAADIQVNQTQQVSNELDGQYLIYTITATCIGPGDATAVQITDNLPSGLISPVILSGSGATITSNKVVWTISSLVNGSNAVLVVKAKINSSGTLVNTATRTSQGVGELDWNHNNDAQTCIMTLSGNYTPTVNMNVDQSPWFYNDLTDNPQIASVYYTTILYNVIVKNTGPTDATGVIVKEVLGDGYQFISCTTRWAGTASYDDATKTVTWNVDYMPTGGKVVLTVFALVIATGNNTPDLTVNASLSHVDQYDNPGSKKCASYSVYVPSTLDASAADNQAYLYLNTILSESNHNIGELFTVKFKLGNSGPDNATNVKIKIPIPEGFQFVSASVDVGHCYYVAATRTLIWELPVVEVGDPYLNLNLLALTDGNYALRPVIIGGSYLLSAGDTVTPFNLNIGAIGSVNENSVNVIPVKALSKTVDMQETGLPLPMMVLSILIIISGVLVKKRK